MVGDLFKLQNDANLHKKMNALINVYKLMLQINGWQCI